MTLPTGSILNHYEITSQIGKGGMGEVYQAKDTKLGRDVAIKVLPEEFARDTDRVARFQREAKLLACLNHPNIAAIHGLEESEGIHFLVLELIEGDTLADRLKSGPISTEEALKLALQIAEALEAAHECGVIHRDLKPANIKVTPEGKAKVLDFGLAKAFAGGQEEMIPSDSPTLSVAATQRGVILGTAAYMSPEQAKGKTVDKRTDIWAFGCVLFEMLTGQAAFQGEDVTEIVASVVKASVNLDLLPTNIHPKVREITSRCMQKDLKGRYQDIGDTRYEMEKILADPRGVLVHPATAVEPQAKLRLILPWAAVALVLGLIIAGLAVWYLKPSEPRPVVRFDYDLTEGQQFGRYGNFTMLAVSPDGDKLVYQTNEGLFLRSMDSLDIKSISGSDGSATAPFFSPDGQWIGYFSGSDQELKRVAISGGVAETLCDAASPAGGFSWSLDNRILYGIGGNIMWIPDDGGEWELLVEQKGRLCGSPQMLPDGKSLLFHDVASEPVKIMVHSLKSGKTEELLVGASPHYLRTDHIVYGLENNLYAVPFDADTLKLTGDSALVVEGVLNSGFEMQYSVSESGTLVYVPGEDISRSTFVQIDREGKAQLIPSAPLNRYLDLRISPDGEKVATSYYDKGNQDIWIYDLVYENMTPLTYYEGDDYTPIWTHDNQRILFPSTRNGEGGIYWRAANSTGEANKIISEPKRELIPWSLSNDGKTLLLMGRDAEGLSQTDIGVLSMEGDRAIKWLLDSKFNEAFPQISPNGKWMAYVSNESGQNEICVCSFPDINKVKRTVSTDGGESPLWSPDGKELFYIRGDAVMVVPVIEAEPDFKYRKPEMLFRGTFFSYNVLGATDIPWDIFPDGERFLMLKPISGDNQEPKINIVLNWFEELKEKVPVP